MACEVVCQQLFDQMNSARKLRDQKLPESARSPIQSVIPKKRTAALKDESEEDFVVPNTRSANRSATRTSKGLDESAAKASQQTASSSKRQRKDQDNSSYKNGTPEIGGQYSTPFTLPSTKLSDEDDQYLSQTATRSTKRAKDPQAYQSPAKPEEVKPSTAQSLDSYLNAENLNKLEKISKQVRLDFNFFNKELLKELSEEEPSSVPIQKIQESVSDRLRRIEGKAELSIESLQACSAHIEKNKLSDKFSRRELQFYELYIKRDEGSEELAMLKQAQMPLEIDAQQYYEQMEVADFTELFNNQCILEDKFGQTLKVSLNYNRTLQALKRQVEEFPEKVTEKPSAEEEFLSSQLRQAVDSRDPELLSIHASLRQFEKEYGKSHAEIAEVFCRVSGRLNKMKDFLEHRPVIEWTFLEDLALSKPDDSPEFQILLQIKGWEEIMIRRDFLHASPMMVEDELKK